MKKIIHERTLCAIAIVAAMPLAACGGDEGPATGAEVNPDSGRPEKTTKKLALGEEATLEGLESAAVKVKVTRVVDPMPNPKTERPKAGRRFVGVRMTIANTSDKPYKDSLLNGSKLVTDVADGANPSILLTGPCASKGAVGFQLPAGKSKSLCLPFQVKKKAKVSAFQFTMNSGFGGQTGEWAVAR